MPEFVVPPGNTMGVRMVDGTTYFPNRQGVVTVSKKHAQEIKTSTAKNTYDMIKERHISLASDPEANRCGTCLFSAQPFSISCPRCHNDLPAKTRSNQ